MGVLYNGKHGTKTLPVLGCVNRNPGNGILLNAQRNRNNALGGSFGGDCKAAFAGCECFFNAAGYSADCSSQPGIRRRFAFSF